jgi:hypothetical protein
MIIKEVIKGRGLGTSHCGNKEMAVPQPLNRE